MKQTFTCGPFPKVLPPGSDGGQSAPCLGGSQMWLPGCVARSTGCGGVSAVNLVLFYLLRRAGEAERTVTAGEYLSPHRKLLGRFPLSGFIPFAWLYALTARRLLCQEGFWGREYVYPLSDVWRGKASIVWFDTDIQSK